MQDYRIRSIDLLRGIVIIIMALDHVRIFFGFGTFFAFPANASTTTPLLFFTRWITHFCAPVFIFLAGISAFLYGTRRKSIKALSWFLFTRGIWLLFVELIFVNFAWTFDITLSYHILQVIWAIGLCMIYLAGIVFLPRYIILAIGIIFVFSHNLLDPIQAGGKSVIDLIWYTLHQQKLVLLGSDSAVNFVYPILPWIGLMALGYIFGTLYQKDFKAQKRRKWLLYVGISSTLLFIVFRLLNIYGDSTNWSVQKSLISSVMSFFNPTKYPPSLLFLLMTMGPSLILLSIIEHSKNRLTNKIIIFGRVPLFFYVIHLYIIHILAIVVMILSGRNWSDYILTKQVFFSESIANFGFGLLYVYLVWVIVILIMFPLCKWYDRYKTNNREKWWLRYL